GVGLGLARRQFPVHGQHEAMEMHTFLAPARHGSIEQVHQEGLAAPDTSPQVDSPRRCRPAAQPFGETGKRPAAALAILEVVEQAGEAPDAGELGGVLGVAEPLQLGAPGVDQGSPGALQRPRPGTGMSSANDSTPGNSGCGFARWRESGAVAASTWPMPKSRAASSTGTLSSTNRQRAGSSSRRAIRRGQNSSVSLGAPK